MLNGLFFSAIKPILTAEVFLKEHQETVLVLHNLNLFFKFIFKFSLHFNWTDWFIWKFLC